MQKQWHAAIRQNLRSETTKKSIAAMGASERRPIEQYLELTDPISTSLPTGLVEAVNRALRGIRTVTLSSEMLVASLRAGGMPCTEAELRQRFDVYLRKALSGSDAANTRLTIAHDEE